MKGFRNMKVFKLAAVALCLGAMGAVPAYASGGSGGGGGGTGGTGGGGGGGGGGTCVTASTLPTTAPAPNVVLRESFGLANGQRPAGGNGCLKAVTASTHLGGFWIEYPGSKNTAWLASGTGQSWNFCAASVDPNEAPSPLQPSGSNGCVISAWTDPVVDHPAALMTFTAPAAPYQVSIDGYPAPVAGQYVGIGFTDSALLSSNLETSAKVWLRLQNGPALNNTTVIYELRVDGMNGPVLATGEVPFEGFNQMSVRYDPVTQTVGASLNGVDLGTYPLTMTAPKFVGFEGVGVLDNFQVKSPL
jgi:hypothetical protein